MSYMAQTVIKALRERKPIRVGALSGAEFRLLLDDIARLKENNTSSAFVEQTTGGRG